LSEFDKVKSYILRCYEQNKQISQVDVLKAFVVIMEKIDEIEKTKKESCICQTTEDAPEISEEKSGDSLCLLHAQRDF